MIRLVALLVVSLFTPVVPVFAQTPRVPEPPGEIVGVGNFAHIVADLDRSLLLYRDVLGLEVVNTIPFAPNLAAMKMGGTEGGQSRVAVLRVPGHELGIALIEYKDIERVAQHPHFVDPGAANMSMRVRDLATLFPKIMSVPGVSTLTVGGKPVQIKLPNGTMHAVFLQDPDGFVMELVEATDPPAGGNPVIAGGIFEPTVRDSEETIRFYNELLGFKFALAETFNDNQQMAATAGAPGSSFRQSRATIPGTSVQMTLIEFGGGRERRELSGRTQDPGTTVLQLIVRDVTSLTRKLKEAGIPILSTGGEPVQINQGLKIAIVRDPNNMLLELIERQPR